jgi:hypothetical protein
MAEQAAIANHLDRETTKIDRLIETVEAAIDRLREYRTALITDTMTGKNDVRRTEPDNMANHSDVPLGRYGNASH